MAKKTNKEKEPKRIRYNAENRRVLNKAKRIEKNAKREAKDESKQRKGRIRKKSNSKHL
jgi:hypothetical protein